MEEFKAPNFSLPKVGVRGIMRGGEMLSSSSDLDENGEFKAAFFPVMESLTAVTKRNEENHRISDLELEIIKLQRDKKNDERRFKEELELLRKEVERKAFKEGQEKGFEEAHNLHQQEELKIRQEFSSFMEQINQSHQTFLDQSDHTLNALLLAALRRITGQWIDRFPDAVSRTVQACLAYLGNENKVVLFLNPEDKEQVESSIQHWLDVEQGRVHFDLQYNPRVPRRSCHMETQAGSVESTIEMILKRMETELQDALGINESDTHIS